MKRGVGEGKKRGREMKREVGKGHKVREGKLKERWARGKSEEGK